MQDLERHRSLQPQLLREIHARHRAFAEQSLDAELSRDDTAQVRVRSEIFPLGSGRCAVLRAEQHGRIVALSTAYAAAAWRALTCHESTKLASPKPYWSCTLRPLHERRKPQQFSTRRAASGYSSGGCGRGVPGRSAYVRGAA